ncbi:MAG: PAS domain S-box protein, partial [Anaerolineales bacterium]
FEALQEDEYIRYEDLPLKTKDGRLVQVEFVSNVYFVDDEKVIQCNIRDVSDRKRAETAREHSEALFQALFELSPDAIVIIDPHDPNVSWPIMDCNAAACRMNGYRRDELIGHSIDILNAAPFTPPGRNTYLEQLREAGNFKLETHHRHKNGIVFPIEVSTAIIRVDGRELIMGIDRDITGRKRAGEALRESEDKFKYVFDYSPVGESITLPSGEVHVNRAFCKMLGFSQDEFENRKWHQVSHPDDIEATQEEMDALLSGEKDVARFTKRYLHKNGSVVWTDVSSALRRDKDGKPLYFMTTMVDVTGRKRAEDALRESERHYRQIVETAGEGIWVIDTENCTTLANKRLAEMLGYSVEEIMDISIFDFIDEEQIARAAASLAQREQGINQQLDLELKRKDGSALWALIEISILQDSDGNYLGALLMLTDITERKRAEKKLSENEARLHLAMNAAEGGVWEWNLQTDENIWSEELWKVYGLEPNSCEPSFETWLQTIHPDDRAVTAQAVQRAAREATDLNTEWRVRDQDGAERWLMSRGQPVFNADGQAVSYIGAVLDITERKHSEEALRLANERLRHFIDANIVGILIANAAGDVLEANDYYLNLIGYTREELEHGQVDWRAITPPEWLATDDQAIRELREGGRCRPYEKEYLLRDGTRVPVFLADVMLPGPGGQIAAFALDITERKQAEKIRRESEERYHSLFENMLNGFAYCKMLFDGERPQDFIYLDVNRAFESLTGLKDVIGKKVSEVIPGIRESDPGLLETYGRVALTGKPEVFEVYMQALKMWFSIAVYSSRKGYFVAVFDVITERKQADEAVKSAKAFLDTVVDMSPFAMWISDKEGTLIRANHSLRDTINLTDDKIVGKYNALKDINLEIQGVMPMVRAVFEKREPARFSIPWKATDAGDADFRDGHDMYIDVSMFPILNAQGELTNVVCQWVDITERKQAEETIRSLARFPSENPNPVLRINRDGKLLYANEAAFAQLTTWDFQADRPAPGILQNVIGEVFEAQKTKTVELPCGERVFWFSIAPAPDDEYVNLYARDVTALFQARDEIRKLNADLEQRVIQRTAQLESANKELEAFSYSVSHDLRAPLRGIDGWSMALLEDYGSLLDEQGKTYLKRVRFETQRMGQLIDDLLQFSRLARVEMRKERVNLGSMARRIAARLQESEPQRQVKFKIQKGLSARGDAHLMEAALTNLLGNAFKFTGKTPQARIEFGQTEIEGQRAFFVRDNGAGFDMAFSKKLFGVFQRLHNASEFPGTGVGLATVQRILHRHGGRIWAESAVNRGATFYFTLDENISTQ